MPIRFGQHLTPIQYLRQTLSHSRDLHRVCVQVRNDGDAVGNDRISETLANAYNLSPFDGCEIVCIRHSFVPAAILSGFVDWPSRFFFGDESPLRSPWSMSQTPVCVN